MTGSHASLIVMPIVISLALATWIGLVYYAQARPAWKHHHARPPRSDVAGGVFEATHGGRQLMPLWGEPPEGIPQPRSATAAESYQAGRAQEAEEEPAPRAGATATASAPPE